MDKLLTIKTLTIRFVLLAGILLSWEVKGQSDENSLLWKIEGKEIKTSYLFGTFHVLPQADFELKDEVRNALLATKQLVMELDMDNPNLQAEMLQNATMNQGMTLDKLLSEDTYKKLDEILKETVGTGAELMNAFKPFMISTLLLKRFIGDLPASFESVLSAIASQQDIEIVGLETIADQMNLFDKISYKNQAEDLVKMLENEEETKKTFSKMAALYKEEKVQELYNQSAQYFDRPGELEILLLNRNEKWIPSFGKFMEVKSTFFGVGAGHLGGKKGLISLLIKAGYQLTPIN